MSAEAESFRADVLWLRVRANYNLIIRWSSPGFHEKCVGFASHRLQIIGFEFKPENFRTWTLSFVQQEGAAPPKEFFGLPEEKIQDRVLSDGIKISKKQFSNHISSSRYAIIGVTEQLLHGRIDHDCKLFINNINK